MSKTINRIFRILASMRLTVICLAFALVLVFAGTLAQVDEGLYAAQNRYFKSFLVWWAPGDSAFQLPILPGGYAVAAILLVNLLAAHVKRFSLRWKKLGVLMIHSGLVLLIVGQVFTDLLSEESTMRLVRGGSVDYSEDLFEQELVIVDATGKEVLIPESSLARKTEIRDGKLPFTIRVRDFWSNARLFGRPTNGATKVPATRGAGRHGVFIMPLPLVVSTDARNAPAALVELFSPKGSLGDWIVSTSVRVPQRFAYQNRQFDIALRAKRHYKPYSITLLDLRHDLYKGTDIPRNFSSRVAIQNPRTGENREVLIYMNNPLRYAGETYYQYQMEKASEVSVLQVVRNPGWLTPYLSCLLVGLGLVVQFMAHLIGFARRRAA